jgi:Mg-chelatase subunit ChlD
VLALVPLIPEYGSWKDINVLLEKTEGMSVFADFQRRCLQFYADALISDRKELEASEAEGRNASLSLSAKYAPRKRKHFGKDGNKFIYDGIRDRLFPSSPTASANYRKLVSRLSRALDLVEVKMCDGRYAKIEFSAVPSRALNIYKNAFLNVTKKDSTENSRHPDNPDRVTCRDNFLRTISDKGKTLKGGQMMPHELVRQFMGRTYPSLDIVSVVQAQWDSLKAETIRSLKSSEAKPAFNLGNVVPLVDVSGSMGGTPMEVAIALGILTSEITSPAFQNRFITFEERPQWVALRGSDSLQRKVDTTMHAGWGGSTNFAAAFELILSVVQKARLPPSEIPTLLVLSDMQFNVADCRFETMHERLTRRFAEVGMATVGAPYTIPQIIYWNLRGDTTNHIATADTPGVQMLSGFSPSLLKQVLNGEIQQKSQKITPYDTLRNVLDDFRYDPVRKILKEVLPNY